MAHFNSLLAQYGLQVEPGQKTSGYIRVAGTPVNMPATVIGGEQPGKQILITAGIHGGEYPCIETAIQLAKGLEPEDVRGTILIIHPVNTPAFFAKLQYYGPYDGKNLNRVFPGKALGTVSERIAHTIHQFQKNADFFIDLHGGDIHEALVPFVIYSHIGEPEVAERSRLASAAVGFPYVVGSYSDNGSIGGAAAAGVAGFLAELGQCGRWSEAEVNQYLDGIYRVLQHLDVTGNSQPEMAADIIFMEKMSVITAQEEGCWYPCKNLEDKVSQGEKIGEIRDFFGNRLREYVADHDGILLYVVTSLAITAGDPLAAIGIIA